MDVVLLPSVVTTFVNFQNAKIKIWWLIHDKVRDPYFLLKYARPLRREALYYIWYSYSSIINGTTFCNKKPPFLAFSRNDIYAISFPLQRVLLWTSQRQWLRSLQNAAQFSPPKSRFGTMSVASGLDPFPPCISQEIFMRISSWL